MLDNNSAGPVFKLLSLGLGLAESSPVRGVHTTAIQPFDRREIIGISTEGIDECEFFTVRVFFSNEVGSGTWHFDCSQTVWGVHNGVSGLVFTFLEVYGP